MNNAFSSSHPLKIPRPYLSLMALEIFMVERPFQHIGDCLEASVRMVGKPSWQLNLEEVHHKERTEIWKFTVSKDSNDLGTNPFILPLRLEYQHFGALLDHTVADCYC